MMNKVEHKSDFENTPIQVSQTEVKLFFEMLCGEVMLAWAPFSSYRDGILFASDWIEMARLQEYDCWGISIIQLVLLL